MIKSIILPDLQLDYWLDCKKVFPICLFISKNQYSDKSQQCHSCLSLVKLVCQSPTVHLTCRNAIKCEGSVLFSLSVPLRQAELISPFARRKLRLVILLLHLLICHWRVTFRGRQTRLGLCLSKIR